MERQVKVTIQKWDKIGRDRIRAKIAETHLNITNLIHEGISYLTIKNYGRGRYLVRKDPSWVAPAPTLMELPQIDISPEPLAHPPDRTPMIYAGTVLMLALMLCSCTNISAGGVANALELCEKHRGMIMMRTTADPDRPVVICGDGMTLRIEALPTLPTPGGKK